MSQNPLSHAISQGKDIYMTRIKDLTFNKYIIMNHEQYW